MRANREERRRQHDCSERASDCFVRTRVGNKFSMTKQMTTDVRKDVFQFRGEDDQQWDRPLVPIVGDVTKMAGAASKKSKSEDTQADALDISFRLRGNQPADSD